MTKLCPGHDDLEAIFANDYATGDHAVTSNDNFSPVHDANMNEVDDQNEDMDRNSVRAPKHNAEGGINKIRCQRTQSHDKSLIALSSIAESSKKIANAMELNHIDWQLVLGKLQIINIDKRDILQVMKVFESDESQTRVFMSLTDKEFMRDLVYAKLDRDPPPQL